MTDPPSPAPVNLLEAVAFAARAHRHQVRKDGLTPYVSHVYRVCTIVREVLGVSDPDVLTAAVLHDAIEDTTTDYDDLHEQFGERIADWVAVLSKDKRLPEEERERDYARRLSEADWQVRLIKLADILDNLIDSRHLSPAQLTRTRERVRFYLDHLPATGPESLQRAKDIVVDAFQREGG